MSSSNTPDASIQSSREFTGSMISFSSQDAFGGQLPKRNRTASETCRTTRQAVRRITEASNTTEFLAGLHERSFHDSQRPQIGTLFYPINSGTSNDLSKKNQTTNKMEYSNPCAGDVGRDPEDKLSGESRPTTHFLRPPSGHKLTEANSKLRKSESSPLRKLALENRHRENYAQLSGVRCLSGFDNGGEKDSYLGAKCAPADSLTMDLAITIYQNPGSGSLSREAWKIHDQKGGSYGSNNRNFDRFATSKMPLNGELRQGSYTCGREFQTWANFVKKVKLSNNPSD